MFDSVKKVRNPNLFNLSKRYLGITDHYIDAKKELGNSLWFNILNSLDKISLKQNDELNEADKKCLRYYVVEKFTENLFLDLNSEFRVLTTSAINSEIQAFISDYEENWDQEKLKYTEEIKSFLKQEKKERDKLLSYITKSFTLLPDGHLDQINQFINSHLFLMAKVILAIKKRNGNFVLKEAECISRWESWRYMAWVLRDVRNNPGKWTVRKGGFNSVKLTIPYEFLENFLKYLIIVTKLNFEDNVFLLTNSSSFMEEDFQLVDLTDDEELNEFIQIKVKEESLDEDDWFKKDETLSISETFTKQEKDKSNLSCNQAKFKIADHYIDAKKELPNSYKKDFFPRLKEIDFNLKQGNELSELEKNFLRYYTFANCSNSDFLNLNSQFRVLTTSVINPEIQSLILGYEESWDQEKLNYVKEIKSFLEQERKKKDELLPYIEDFTTLPNEYLDQIDQFINSYTPLMAKVILSIKKRNGSFILKEVECISRWESWRYMAWVLRDVRDNPGKWIVERYDFFNSIEFTISFTFLEIFLKHLTIVARLSFEDNVFLLTNSSSFMKEDFQLVDSIDDEELNELNKVEVKEKSLDSSNWLEEDKTSSILEVTELSELEISVQHVDNQGGSYLNPARYTEKSLEDNEVHLSTRRRELKQGRKELINDEAKLEQDREVFNKKREQQAKKQAEYEKAEEELSKKVEALDKKKIEYEKNEERLRNNKELQAKEQVKYSKEQAELKKGNKELIKERKQQDKELGKIRQFQIKLEEMNDDIQNKANKKKKKIEDDLNDVKEKARKETETLANEIKGFTNIKIKLSDEVETLKKKKVKLENQLEEVEIQIKGLNSQVEASREEVRRSNELKTQLNSEIESSKIELTQLREERKDLNKDIEDLRIQKKNSEDESIKKSKKEPSCEGRKKKERKGTVASLGRESILILLVFLLLMIGWYMTSSADDELPTKPFYHKVMSRLIGESLYSLIVQIIEGR